MPAPTGFAWSERKDGDVVITHHGRPAATLRGARARAFIAALVDGDPQQVMARATGNHKRGNERCGRFRRGSV